VTDKGADVLIGDHMKGKTPGFVSYHWIEECCAKGKVVDMAPHVIVVNKPSIRTGGPAGMRTARRNEFTPQEDSLLIEFLKSQVAVNKPIGGNAPYNAFADAVCPLKGGSLTIASTTPVSIVAESMAQSSQSEKGYQRRR
jgi:hypothetical protein